MRRLAGGITPLHRFLPLAVAALYFGLALHGTSNKSGTFDEYIHVTGGYSYWKFSDFRLHPENGNWAQRIVAVPAVLSGAHFPTLDQPAWRSSDFWALSDQFFFAGPNDATRLLWPARAMVAAVGALLCLAVFYWARRLWGAPGAWVSLILVAFSPSMLAHGALATSDMIAAAFFLASLWSLWRVIHRVTPTRLLLSVFSVAGLFLSKYSAITLIPIALTLLAIRLLRPDPLTLRVSEARQVEVRGRRRALALLALTAVHVAAVATIIWASYGFRFSGFNDARVGGGEYINSWASISDASAAGKALQWARRQEILPESYLFGLGTVRAYSKNRSAFANGEFSQDGGWRWFFPYAAMVKSTPPALILVATSPFFVLAARRRKESSLPPFPAYDLAPLLVMIAWYGGFAVFSTLNIGHRHLLPLIPATAILLGVAGEPMARLLGQTRVATQPR